MIWIHAEISTSRSSPGIILHALLKIKTQRLPTIWFSQYLSLRLLRTRISYQSITINDFVRDLKTETLHHRLPCELTQSWKVDVVNVKVIFQTPCSKVQPEWQQNPSRHDLTYLSRASSGNKFWNARGRKWGQVHIELYTSSQIFNFSITDMRGARSKQRVHKQDCLATRGTSKMVKSSQHRGRELGESVSRSGMPPRGHRLLGLYTKQSWSTSTGLKLTGRRCSWAQQTEYILSKLVSNELQHVIGERYNLSTPKNSLSRQHELLCPRSEKHRDKNGAVQAVKRGCNDATRLETNL